MSEITWLRACGDMALKYPYDIDGNQFTFPAIDLPPAKYKAVLVLIGEDGNEYKIDVDLTIVEPGDDE